MDVDALVAAHLGWIGRAAARYCADPADAADLAGDTVLKLLESRGRYDPRRAFKPWALAVMRNTYITGYNRRRCVEFTRLDRCRDRPGGIGADQLAAVRLALSALRACARMSVNVECVALYAKGYSCAEIAERTGIPVGTVRSRIFNGRRMLRGAICGGT